MAAQETTIIESEDRIKNPVKIFISLELTEEQAINLMGQVTGQIGIAYDGSTGEEQYKKHYNDQKKGAT